MKKRTGVLLTSFALCVAALAFPLQKKSSVTVKFPDGNSQRIKVTLDSNGGCLGKGITYNSENVSQSGASYDLNKGIVRMWELGKGEAVLQMTKDGLMVISSADPMGPTNKDLANVAQAYNATRNVCEALTPKP